MFSLVIGLVRFIHAISIAAFSVIMKLLMYALSILCLFVSLASDRGVEATTETAGAISKYSGVFEVTSANAREFLDADAILLEFYAPWCGHCSNFKPAYQEVAAELTKNNAFRVGMCDITANAAMSGRFDVREIPALYLYKRGELYKYSGPFHASAIKTWAVKEFTNNAPIPMYLSPLGPLGNLKGLLIHGGVSLTQFVPNLSETLGIPEYLSIILIASGLGLSILACTFVGVFVSVSHEKED